jgi:hypothetical protein
MPTDVGIHVVAANAKKIRGWRAFAHHDAVPPPAVIHKDRRYRRFTSWCDTTSVYTAAAPQAGCDVLWTEDMQDGHVIARSVSQFNGTDPV